MAEALDSFPLLESFPAPPSFIPQSPGPSNAFNPPPSGPPLSPLPPVPGPSRISEQDTLLFLSRRSSKYSVASSTRPQSILSIDSVDRSLNRRDSVSSSISATSLTIKHNPPRSARRARSPKPSIQQEGIVEEPHGVPEDNNGAMDLQEFGVQPSSHNEAEDSISSITMHDLPANDDDDETGPPLDLSSFHRQHRTNRTRSASHRNLLASQSNAPPPSPVPIAVDKRHDDEPRAISPDLPTLLSHTPRPRRSSSAAQSRSRSRHRLSSGKSRRASEGLSSRGSRSSGGLSNPGFDLKQERKSWGDEEDDYGVEIRGKFSGGLHGPELEAEEEIARLERALDGEGSESGSDSDSSLDLHTPLPHLMLRHGVLSPNSKLLSSNSSRLSTSSLPNTPMDGRPSSVHSTASTADSLVTKSGLIKDSRNTPLRKVRHRDGRTLRGGLGLTTGLGWSDSEDEDAPSPLTRRLSSLTSRTKSLSSSSSGNRSSSYSKISSKHPLSRSYSYGTLDIPEGSDDDDDYAVTNTFSGYAARPRKPSAPPTAWTKTRVPPSGSRGSVGSRNGARSSSGSAFSLEVTIPDDEHRNSTPSATKRRTIDSDDMQLTPSSTASSMSMPRTPTEPASPLMGFKTRTLNREKSLPSLPNPRTGSIRYGGGRPEKAQPVPTSTSAGSVENTTRTQMGSSVSNPSIGLPRPLQLASRNTPGTPSKSHTSRSFSGPPSTPQPQMRTQIGRARTSEPIPPTPPLPKPRPRTGTGMAYRSSSSNIQSLNLPSAAASRMPVRSPTQKPIAL